MLNLIVKAPVAERANRAHSWKDLAKAPVSPSMLLNPRRYGDGAKDLFIRLNCVQENIIRGG
jgi:hypothetical protein